MAWTRADFEQANEEIPDKLLEDDIHTEGELMSREEIDDWIADTFKTFCIVREENTGVFDKLYDEFILDIHYLEELGKITPEEAKDILEKDKYKF